MVVYRLVCRVPVPQNLLDLWKTGFLQQSRLQGAEGS